MSSQYPNPSMPQPPQQAPWAQPQAQGGYPQGGFPVASPPRRSALVWVALGLAGFAFLLGVIPATSGIAWLPALAAIVIAIIALVRRAAPTWPAIVALVLAPLAWLIAIIVTVVSLAAGFEAPSAQQPAPPETLVTQPAEEEIVPAESGAAEDGEPEPDPVDVAEPTEFAIGDQVTVGDWIVTIGGVGEPLASIGGEYLNTQAQGTYVPISITMQNNGNEAQYFFASDLVAIDAQGREFEYSSDAAIYSGDDGAAMLDEVNPGNSLTGTLYYDVPEGTTLVSILVDNGWFDEPVSIRLE